MNHNVSSGKWRAKAPASRTHSKRFATYHAQATKFAKRLECVRLAGAFALPRRCPGPSCIEATQAATILCVANALSTALAPLDRLIASRGEYRLHPIPSAAPEARESVLPAYVFFGPRGGGDPIRIGLF